MVEFKQKTGILIAAVKGSFHTLTSTSRSLGIANSVICVGILVGMTAAACKKAKKIDKRHEHESADVTGVGDNGAEDTRPFTVKADSFSFRILEKINIEPESCLPIEFNVVGGESEKYLATAPEDLEIKPSITSNTGAFFSDDKCQNPISVLSVPKDSDGGMFYLKEKSTGEWKLQIQTEKGPPFKSPDLSLTVAKGDSLKLELIPTRTFTLENCEPIILSLRAAGDKDTISAQAFKVKVNVTAGSAKVFTTDNCSGEPQSTVEVPILNPSITLFVRPASSGPLTINTEPDSATGYKKSEITVNVDPKAS
jgi:hypothetical protein